MLLAAKCGCNTDSNGIVGFTLKPETLKTWALSRHIYSRIMEDIENKRGIPRDEKYKDTHKETADTDTC